ncbi:hypothetical protein HJ590_12140 [Naumannella sp. ID2617S]|nr:hypothetical protein [Naumannella sp. ID2617S]
MPASALNHLGRVTGDTRRKAEEVLSALESQTGHRVGIIYGYNPASQPEHSAGRALDFMCNRETGDWIADYLWTHRARLRVKWILWRQRIRSTSAGKPNSWQAMPDRGNATQNHYDHVHVFFNDGYESPSGATAPPAAGEAPGAAAWWGNRPEPQDPAWLSVTQLRQAMEHDTRQPGQPLGWFADQVWFLQRMLIATGWLRREKIVPGHYGTLTAGDAGNRDDGGVRGFQAKRGHTPDGWPGPSELAMLMDWSGMRCEVRP